AYDRTVSAADEALIRAAVAEHIPAANGRLIAAKTCLYTMTPDGDFLIDRLPGASNIIVASPCSGHGFKFAPVIGEILADLATTGAPPHDMARFSLGRFGGAASGMPQILQLHGRDMPVTLGRASGQARLRGCGCCRAGAIYVWSAALRAPSPISKNQGETLCLG